MYWIVLVLSFAVLVLVLENRTMVENELRLVRNSMKSTSTGLCPKYEYDFQYPTLKSNIQGIVDTEVALQKIGIGIVIGIEKCNIKCIGMNRK